MTLSGASARRRNPPPPPPVARSDAAIPGRAFGNTAMDELKKLMIEQLRDAYSAERQGLRAMPRLAKKASS